MLLSQQYIDSDGNIMRLISNSEIKSDKPLILNYELNKFIKLISLPSSQLNEEEKEYISANFERVYKELLEILKTQYKVFDSISLKLENKKKEFLNLNDESKKVIINELIKLMKTGQGNLKLIGLTDREGRMNGKNFSEKHLKNMTFIDKSITGIYERRYKIDGVEDNTCK